MARPVPQAYPPVVEPAIATFDFTDVAENTGIVILKAATTITSGATAYILTSSDVFSASIESAAAPTTTSFVKFFDLDFDLSPFNLPKNIQGTGFTNVPVGAYAGPGHGTYVFVIVRLSKWDGTTETVLATATSPSMLVGTSTGETRTQIMNLPLVIPRTHFSKGDQLRFSVELWGKGTESGGEHDIALGHDPQNRDAEIIQPSSDDPLSTTKLQVGVPFDLGL